MLATLLFPAWLFNFGFLRVLRLWTLLHSEFFWRTRRATTTTTPGWRRSPSALASLVTFMFVVTGFVYASFRARHPGISGYLDALYFTVATLTTTGFGDITLPGNWGRVLSIVVMLTGITLFLRLAQTIFRPHKIKYLLPDLRPAAARPRRRALQGVRRGAVHSRRRGVTEVGIRDEG